MTILNARPSRDGLVFSSAVTHQVALIAGNWHSLELLNNNLATNFSMERASTVLDSILALGSGATGGRN